MPDSAIYEEPQDQRLAAHRWKGAPSIGLAHQLNERCIDLACELALARQSDVPWSVVMSNRDLWRRLDLNARRRLATFPFVIVDICFKDELWWADVCEQGLAAAGQSADVNDKTWSRCDWLTLETLLCAWQIARQDRGVAQMIFAMRRSVAERIATLTMQQVRAVAIDGAQTLRVRWDDEPGFWRELLIAVEDGDERQLVLLRREARLRFGGELLQATA